MLHGLSKSLKMNLPTKLYKYRPLATDLQAAMVKHVIVDSKFYFAPPGAFCDPFEFQVQHEGRRSRVYEGGWGDNAPSVGLLSLSEKRDDILMWSFYADWHRGICMGFRVDPACPFFSRIREVLYRDDMPGSGERRASQTKFLARYLAKSRAWQHEREWRIIEEGAGGELRSYPTRSLCEIVLGCRIAKDREAQVRRWASGLPHVAVKKAEVDPCRYALLT
jgi:hypothetical protein